MLKFYCLFAGLFIVVQNALCIEPDSTSNVKLLFLGDVMGHDAQIEAAYNASDSSYSYWSTFSLIADYLGSADICIANLEVTLAGEPFKGYPQFSSPDQLAIDAQKAGVDVFITANNHCLDRGSKGFNRTLDVLDTLGIFYTGTFRNQEERDLYYPLMIEKKGIRIALLNYTYGTNGLKVSPPLLVNRIDTSIIRKDVLKAQNAGADLIIATMHWGTEYQRVENSEQNRLAEYMFGLGVGAIIGSHPHVVQPIRNEYPDLSDSSNYRPVYYSLGNFVSNQRARYKDGGIIAELHISKKDDVAQIDSSFYMPYWVHKSGTSPNVEFSVIPVPKYELADSVADLNESDLYRFNRFINDTRELLDGNAESNFYK